MTENTKGKDFNLDHLLHPAGAFQTPMEVVNDPDMTVQEKRAILASWASDACAVEAAPELRAPPSAAPVRFDDIMDALKQLDGKVADQPNYGKFINRARRWKDLYRKERLGRHLFARGATLCAMAAVVFASVSLAGDARAGSLLRKVEAQDARSIEAYLPPATTSIPWLDLDTRTRLPKGDLPIGRDASVAGFVLPQPSQFNVQITANEPDLERRL